MARPEYSFKHVPSSALLPENLTRGRIYFLDDEGTIIINHGRGPVTYGHRRGLPGPPGPAGDPQPELQEQINLLIDAVFSLAELVSRLRSRVPTDNQEEDEL